MPNHIQQVSLIILIICFFLFKKTHHYSRQQNCVNSYLQVLLWIYKYEMWNVRPQHYYLRQCTCTSLFPIVCVCLNKSETFAKISKTCLFSKCAPMETWHVDIVEVVEHRRNCQLVKWVTEWISEWLGNYIIEDNPLHCAEVVMGSGIRNFALSRPFWAKVSLSLSN